MILFIKKKILKELENKQLESFDNLIIYDFNNGDQMIAMYRLVKKVKYVDMLELNILSSEYKDWNLKQSFNQH